MRAASVAYAGVGGASTSKKTSSVVVWFLHKWHIDSLGVAVIRFYWLQGGWLSLRIQKPTRLSSVIKVSKTLLQFVAHDVNVQFETRLAIVVFDDNPILLLQDVKAAGKPITVYQRCEKCWNCYFFGGRAGAAWDASKRIIPLWKTEITL